MDLPVYVEYGAADIGIIGKDVLKEEERDVYELLDMGYGKCHLMMAVPEEKVLPRMMDYTICESRQNTLTVLSSSLTGRGCRWRLSSSMVPLNWPRLWVLVNSLSILWKRDNHPGNHLKEVATVYESSARLIANKVSFKLQHERIKKLVEDLKAVLKEEEA